MNIKRGQDYNDKMFPLMCLYDNNNWMRYRADKGFVWELGTNNYEALHK